MATILAKLLDGKIPCEDLISALACGNISFETEPGKFLSGENLFIEFVPFLLNYLRDQTSHHLTSRQSALSSPKKCPSKDKTRKDFTQCGRSEHLQGQKNCVRGGLFSQKTPSPLSQNKKLQDRFASPSSSPRRKSPVHRGPQENRHTSQSFHGSKINLDDPEDFPPVGSSTPSKKGRTPRRITPTPVKEEQSKRRGTPSPFSSGSFVTSPLAMESQGSPVSFQEERNMIKMIRSKRRSKGDSPWGGIKTSPSPVAGSKTPPLPVFGDFIATSSPKRCFDKSLDYSEGQAHGGTGNVCEASLICSVDETSLDKEKNEQSLKQADISLVIVSKELVTHKEKLQLLAKVYSKCVTDNLVPNVTAELYFIVQLLTAKGQGRTSGQEGSEAQEGAQKSKTVEQSDNWEQNLLVSIHNCVFFAASVLEKLERIVSLLGKGTLHLLADNPRVTEFSPALQQQLQKQYNDKLAAKPPEVSVKSPLGGVPFSAERDNKQNYPSDKAFHNFRKQRDAFYELVREWEDCRTKPGWSVEESMGTRIRSVVHQQQALANHAHLARLFQSQLLQMCKGESEGTAESADLLTSLRKSNPEKFQRLRERLVTPLSSGGPCPQPSFAGPQEFFKSFIVSAASHSFSRHLMDLLIMKIIELNDSEFPIAELKEDRSIPNQEVRRADRFTSCLFTLRILAKFLGFLVFEPYQGMRTAAEVLQMRNKVPVQFDVLSYIKASYREGRLMLTVPWIVEYLSMMDPVAPHLDYYVETLQALLHIYRSARSKLSGSDVSCGHLLLAVCLGWLFETPALPGSSFFRPVSGFEGAMDVNSETDIKFTLDSSGFVDQHVLYSCCPYLGEIRSVLAEAAAGMYSRAAGPVKKITPICADEPAKSSSHRHLQLQLEENFFRIQPDFLKRLSDFVVDRLNTNILHHIKGTIIPALLEKGGKQIQAFLEADFPTGTRSHQAKDKCRPHTLKITHSMTDEGVKRASDAVESCSKQSLDAFHSLCPKDMNYKVVKTAAAISTRLIKEKVTDWIKISLPNSVEKELFTQFDKIVNSILSTRAKRERDSLSKTQGDSDELSNRCTVKTVGEQTTASFTSSSCRAALSPDAPLTLIRAMQKTLTCQSSLLTERSPEDTHSDVEDVLSYAQEFFCRDKQGLSQHNEAVLAGQISIELVFILACRSCYGVKFTSRYEDDGAMTRLLRLWRHLADRRAPVPFHSLLSHQHLHLISALENTEAVWQALKDLFISLLDRKLVNPDALDSWFISAMEQTKDEETQEGVARLACHIVRSYYRKRNQMKTENKGSSCPTGNSTAAADFSLLFAVLTQRLPNNDTIRNLLEECAKDSAGKVVLS